MTFHATESFPFGDVTMSCVLSSSSGNSLAVQRVAFTPTLPDGMTVDLVAAYRVSFYAEFPVHDFSFDFTRTECLTNGNAESGEGLEAQSWQIDEGLLMFGTEDGESLLVRMPWLTIQGKDYPVEYLHNGFRITISYISPRTPVGFHFVLAYNQVDTGADSEWFAIDVPHSILCELSVLKNLDG